MTTSVAILIFAQTVFYLTVSLAILILSIMIGLVIYRLIKVAKSLENISENIGQMSDDLREGLENTLENLFSLPFFSMFFRKKEKEPGRKKQKVKLL